MPAVRSTHRLVLSLIGALAGLGAGSPARAAAPHGPRHSIARTPDGARRTQSTPHLSWGGGRVLTNVKVFVILWGNNVDPDTVAMLPGWFQTITQSPWMDVMAEYATATQQIGRGSFEMMVTDPTPISATTVTDADMENEVAKAIDQLGLPPPDENSVYFLIFPPGMTVGETGSSCTFDCAYHSNFFTSQEDVTYVPIPDCTKECDSGTAFENLAVVASHELAESITDPDTGNGWYDDGQAGANQGQGEIADICRNFYPDLGFTLDEAVQLIWSNYANACVDIRPPDNDFEMSTTPTTVSLALGATTTVPIVTSITKGVAEPLTLSVTGASNGLTASVAPTMINSGDPATLTITTTADADQVRVNVDTTATNGNYNHVAPLTVTVGTPGDFTVALSPMSQDVMIGETATYTVTVGLVTQPVGAVTLAPLDLGPGLRVTFDPAVIMPGDSSTMTLSVGLGAVAGKQFFSLQGSADATVHAIAAEVIVDVPDAATFDVRLFPDARPHPGGAGEDSPAGACALGTPGRGRGASGALVLGLLVGLALLSRRLAPRRAP